MNDSQQRQLNPTYRFVTRYEKPTTATVQSEQIRGDATMKLNNLTRKKAESRAKSIRTLSAEECRLVSGGAKQSEAKQYVGSMNRAQYAGGGKSSGGWGEGDFDGNGLIAP